MRQAHESLADWSITHDPVERLFRIRLPEYVSTGIARAAVADLVKRVIAEHSSSVLIADLRDIRRFDSEAPVVAAHTFRPIVRKIEHAHLVTPNPVVRAAAAAAAQSIGLRFTSHKTEPDLSRTRVPAPESPNE